MNVASFWRVVLLLAGADGNLRLAGVDSAHAAAGEDADARSRRQQRAASSRLRAARAFVAESAGQRVGHG